MPKQKPADPKARRSPLEIHLPEGFNPKFATFIEACAYARVSRFIGNERIAEGRWEAFREGRRLMVVFSSVRTDLERMRVAGAVSAKKPTTKRPPGRPRNTPSIAAE